MSPADALVRLRELVAEERQAIRTIDTDRVVALAEEKERLMLTVRDGATALAAEERATFRQLAVNLRENGVLLAHARNCLRDVLQLVSASPATYGTQGAIAGETRGRRVSVAL